MNIAVIKYWGKRDESLVLPTNDSLSVTLAREDLRTTTTVSLSSDYSQDSLWLNGRLLDVFKDRKSRLAALVEEARRLRRLMETQDASLAKLSTLNIHIASVNSFPTAAGLASSASGAACLAFCLFKLFGLTDSISIEQASVIARLGSGSACRSMMGGFVAWRMGSLSDGSDSLCAQIASVEHWPDLHCIVLVVSDAEKDTPSTSGMRETCLTSSLFAHRVSHVVPKRMESIEKAIACKDFDAFAELTMKDSNQFHALCLDTFPPIVYMNSVSHRIVKLITLYNSLFLFARSEAHHGAYSEQCQSQGYRVAYTFDAGPNAVLYLPKQHVSQVLALVRHFFPSQRSHNESFEYLSPSAMPFISQVDADEVSRLVEAISPMIPVTSDGLARIICTKIGDGPQVISTQFDDASLLDINGLPRP